MKVRILLSGLLKAFFAWTILVSYTILFLSLWVLINKKENHGCSFDIIPKSKGRVLGVLLSTFSLMCYALEVKDF